MGDDHDGLAAGGQVAGQPVDALDVEVVGRLVEHQQVVVDDQRAGQRDPAPLAAGERADPAVEHRVEVRPARRRARPAPRAPGVRGPLVRRAVADDQRRARSPSGSSSSPWATDADAQAAGVGDPAGVGRLAPGQQPQQRRLAVAVAADDADRSPSATPRETPSSRVRVPYPLVTLSRLTRLRAATQASPTRRAPPTGPCARLTARQVPLALSATAMSSACSAAAGQEHHGRPAARDQRAERARLLAGLEGRAQRRPQRHRRRLQVVVQGAAQRPRRRRPAARPSSRRSPAAPAAPSRRAAGRTRRRPPASTARRRRARPPTRSGRARAPA